MAKIRHIAMQVPDLEKAAAFYVNALGLQQVHSAQSPIGNAISLSDGHVNLTLLAFPDGTKGAKHSPAWAGLHHIGFVIEPGDAKGVASLINDNGGKFFMQLPSYPGVDAEMKYADLNGVVFDVAEHDWVQAKD